MLMLNRNRNKAKRAICISAALLLTAHVAAGIMLCKASPRPSKFGRAVKKVKRTAVGLVRELF